MGRVSRLVERRRIRRAAELALLRNVALTTATQDTSPPPPPTPAPPPQTYVRGIFNGMWPGELDRPDPRTAQLADQLRAEMGLLSTECIQALHTVRLTAPPETVLQDQQARIVNEARAKAKQRIQWTLDQLQPRPQPARAVTDPDTAPMRIPQPGTALVAQPVEAATPSHNGAAHRDDQPVTAITRSETRSAPVPLDEPTPVAATPAPSRSTHPAPAEPAEPAQPAVEPVEADTEGVAQLLGYVAHQEPRIAWAVSQRPDGRYLLASDLAHGWIPPHIVLPAGLQLLAPALRAGSVTEFLGENALASAVYRPGDPLPDVGDDDMPTAADPRQVPTIDEIGWKLTQATAWRAGLAPIAHTLVTATAEGTGITAVECDILNKHAADAYETLLDDYPQTDRGLMCNCLLLLAAESFATGDSHHASYHYSWFQALDA